MLGMKFSICGASRLETEMGETSRESARQNESSRSTSPSSVSAKDVAAPICSCRPTFRFTRGPDGAKRRQGRRVEPLVGRHCQSVGGHGYMVCVHGQKSLAVGRGPTRPIARSRGAVQFRHLLRCHGSADRLESFLSSQFPMVCIQARRSGNKLRLQCPPCWLHETFAAVFAQRTGPLPGSPTES